MCKGVEEGNHGGGGSGCRQFPEVEMVMCELCDSRASLYCQADEAYLCRKCDKLVHGANFLAHRHIRCILCKFCQNLTEKYLARTSTELLLPAVVTCTQAHPCNNNGTLHNCCNVMLKWPFLLF